MLQTKPRQHQMGWISTPAAFILFVILMAAVSHGARPRELDVEKVARRNLLNNGLGHTPQMGWAYSVECWQRTIFVRIIWKKLHFVKKMKRENVIAVNSGGYRHVWHNAEVVYVLYSGCYFSNLHEIPLELISKIKVFICNSVHHLLMLHLNLRGCIYCVPQSCPNIAWLYAVTS